MVLPTRVNLYQAVSIQPLTDDQIERYLQSTKGQLEQLRQALHRDPELYELVHRPLMLNIFTLAYQVAAPTDLPTGATQEQILQAVFADYVEHMLSRRGILRRWTREQFLHWLTTIAKQLHREQQSIFQPEDLQIDWLPEKQRRRYQQSVGLFFKLIFGWATLLLMSTFFGGIFLVSWAVLQSFGVRFGLRPGGIIFVVIGLIIGLYEFSENQLAEHIDLYLYIKVEDVLFGLLGLFLWFELGVLKVAVFVLLFGMPPPALIIWFVAGGLLTELLTLALSKEKDSTSFLGGLIQHFALRVFLWYTDSLPWKITVFLDEAAKRLFLRKAGGGYIFVHRLLLEYCASLGTGTPANT